MKLLDKIKVNKFSIFQDLRIGHIGKFNLIVGRNNVGKTQLLHYIKQHMKMSVILIDRDIPRGSITQDLTVWWKSQSESLHLEILETLRQIDPEIEKIELIYDDACIKLSNCPNSSPLKFASDGFLRVLQIFRTVIDNPEATILIDEVENALHFSVYPYLFEFLSKQVKNNEVQIFMTTHSLDIIHEFFICWEKNDENFGAFIRMYRQEGVSKANEYSREELSDALSENFDVR